MVSGEQGKKKIYLFALKSISLFFFLIQTVAGFLFLFSFCVFVCFLSQVLKQTCWTSLEGALRFEKRWADYPAKLWSDGGQALMFIVKRIRQESIFLLLDMSNC